MDQELHQQLELTLQYEDAANVIPTTVSSPDRIYEEIVQAEAAFPKADPVDELLNSVIFAEMPGVQYGATQPNTVAQNYDGLTQYVMDVEQYSTTTQQTAYNEESANNYIDISEYYPTVQQPDAVQYTPSPLSSATSGYCSEGSETSSESQLYSQTGFVQSNLVQIPEQFELQYGGVAQQYQAQEQPQLVYHIVAKLPDIVTEEGQQIIDVQQLDQAHQDIVLGLLQPNQESYEVPQQVLDMEQPSTSTDQPKRRGRRPLPRKPVTDSEFHCLPCNKVFKRRRGLMQHNHYTHAGPRDFSCDTCGKRYIKMELLETHMSRHIDENKPHGCPHQCRKRFQYLYDLQRHIKQHHGDAPYKCKYCGKGFTRRGHCENHEVSHENNTAHKKRATKPEEAEPEVDTSNDQASD